MATYAGGANPITTWEVGNEWFKMEVTHSTALSRYVSCLNSVVAAMRNAPNGSTIEIYATMDWLHPNDAATIAGSTQWSNIDGISIHPYAGDEGDAACPTCTISQLATNVDTIRSSSGRSNLKLYASEWSAARMLSSQDRGLANANIMIAHLQTMQRKGFRLATYWPVIWPTAPGIQLVDTEANSYAQLAAGQVFSWLAANFYGTSYPATSNTGASYGMAVYTAAPRYNVMIAARDSEAHRVTIQLKNGASDQGFSSVHSVKVLGSSDPTGSIAAATVTDLTSQCSTSPTAIHTCVVDPAIPPTWIKVDVNVGTSGHGASGPGRGSSYEIVKVMLNP